MFKDTKEGTENMYYDRISRGYRTEDVMASIYARSRDNARTPMQWSPEAFAGFSQVKPWLPVNANYKETNVQAALADPESVFYYYQKLIALRKRLTVFRDGCFTLLEPEDKKRFLYTRDTEWEHLLVVCNFTAEAGAFILPKEFRQAELLLSNYEDQPDQLRPYEARMYYSCVKHRNNAF